MSQAVAIELAAAAGLIVILTTAYLAGRRLSGTYDEPHPRFDMLQGALLGLLALLIGFTFAGASERFQQRQEILIAEANALGTAWLRGDLLEPTERAEYRRAMRAYTETRLELFGEEVDENAEQARLTALQTTVWAAAVAGIRAKPEFAEVVLPPVNDVFDLLSTRNAATRRHLPLPILVVLLACAMLAVGSIGYGLGRRGARLQVPAIALILLIACALWLVIDLDYPRFGLVRISDGPLRAALVGMVGG